MVWNQPKLYLTAKMDQRTSNHSSGAQVDHFMIKNALVYDAYQFVTILSKNIKMKRFFSFFHNLARNRFS